MGCRHVSDPESNTSAYRHYCTYSHANTCDYTDSRPQPNSYEYSFADRDADSRSEPDISAYIFAFAHAIWWLSHQS